MALIIEPEKSHRVGNCAQNLAGMMRKQHLLPQRFTFELQHGSISFHDFRHLLTFGKFIPLSLHPCFLHHVCHLLVDSWVFLDHQRFAHQVRLHVQNCKHELVLP